ncbi:MAG: MnhB domain-containing protein [bacterium]|nr:MnhB domain-containing protein [bacterium]
MNSLILKTIAPIVLHLTLLVSFFLLLYGHNQPGGGFIAGLMTVVGMVLQWVAFDADLGWRRFNRSWDRMFGSGLILATLVGVFGLLSGAFLKSSIYEFEVPFIGNIEIFTAFLFDLGVYGVVVGVSMSILTIFSDRRSPLHLRD